MCKKGRVLDLGAEKEEKIWKLLDKGISLQRD